MAGVHTKAIFDVGSLESRGLMELFHETNSHVQGIGIEIVHDRGREQGGEKHPAMLIGVGTQNPAIRFLDSLDREERIEAIAHELAHLLLIYRSGLRLICVKRPHPEASAEVFERFINMSRDCFSLLGQIANTAHHLILIDYLKEQHGIESNLHLHLLHYHFFLLHDHSHIPAGEANEDKESLYAKGMIAFEYDRLLDKIDRVFDMSRQTDAFRKAFGLAEKRLGGYRLQSIPTSSSYEEDILSLLEDLGYERQDFAFLP